MSLVSGSTGAFRYCARDVTTLPSSFAHRRCKVLPVNFSSRLPALMLTIRTQLASCQINRNLFLLSSTISRALSGEALPTKFLNRRGPTPPHTRWHVKPFCKGRTASKISCTRNFQSLGGTNGFLQNAILQDGMGSIRRHEVHRPAQDLRQLAL